MSMTCESCWEEIARLLQTSIMSNDRDLYSQWFDKPIGFLFATGCRFGITVDIATLHPCCSQKLHLL